MTPKIILLLAAAILALSTVSLTAGEHAEQTVEMKMVIALHTDDFELAETDISGLEIGEAETIYTESGKTIDLLRTADGVEIYVDGELLETGFDGEECIHEGHHIVHKRIEVICESDEDCEEVACISGDEDIDLLSLHVDGHHEKVIIIKKMADSEL